MTTYKDIKSLTSIYILPKDIHCNKDILLDPFLDDNLSDTPKTALYDFDVFLKDYNINLQRPYVWNMYQQQEFILSLLQEKPIPPVVVVQIDSMDSLLDKELKRFLVIDGKQRLLTIKRFLNDEFSVPINGRQVLYQDFDEESKYFFIRTINFLHASCYYASDNPKDPWFISDRMKIILFNYYNFAGTQQEASHKEKLQALL